MPLPSSSPRSVAVGRTLDRIALILGLAIRDARTRHGWPLRELARRAGVSVATVHGVEAGRPANLDTYARIASALGLRLEATLTDPRRPSAGRGGDPVHAAMGAGGSIWIGPWRRRLATRATRRSPTR